MTLQSDSHLLRPPSIYAQAYELASQKALPTPLCTLRFAYQDPKLQLMGIKPEVKLAVLKMATTAFLRGYKDTFNPPTSKLSFNATVLEVRMTLESQNALPCLAEENMILSTAELWRAYGEAVARRQPFTDPPFDSSFLVDSVDLSLKLSLMLNKT